LLLLLQYERRRRRVVVVCVENVYTSFFVQHSAQVFSTTLFSIHLYIPSFKLHGILSHLLYTSMLFDINFFYPTLWQHSRISKSLCTYFPLQIMIPPCLLLTVRNTNTHFYIRQRHTGCVCSLFSIFNGFYALVSFSSISRQNIIWLIDNEGCDNC